MSNWCCHVKHQERRRTRLALLSHSCLQPAASDGKIKRFTENGARIHPLGSGETRLMWQLSGHWRRSSSSNSRWSYLISCGGRCRPCCAFSWRHVPTIDNSSRRHSGGGEDLSSVRSSSIYRLATDCRREDVRPASGGRAGDQAPSSPPLSGIIALPMIDVSTTLIYSHPAAMSLGSETLR